MDKFPLAPEGIPILAGALFLALVATWMEVWWLAPPLWAAAAFIAFFFRDPARTSPEPENRIISPADGKVVAVGPVESDSLPDGRATMVSIFMSIFNVHVNRAPIAGRVEEVTPVTGGFLRADLPGASRGNERVELVFRSPGGTALRLAQVAGMVARRVECRVRPGDLVRRGQRFGMIRFGSRLDVYLPPTARVLVAPGDRVKAGVTALGEKTEEPGA